MRSVLRRSIGIALTLALIPAAITFGAIEPAAATDAHVTVTTFDYTGSAVEYPIPDGIDRLLVIASGAAGSLANVSGAGSNGAVVSAIVDVAGASTATVTVGGMGLPADGTHPGSGGFNGGGSGGGTFAPGSGAAGGGATDLRLGGTGLVNRVLVAGGGGGAGSTIPGVGGTPIGGNASGSTGGQGGTLSAPGAGGTASGSATSGGDGALGVGGNGGTSDNGARGGAGGGGGYYGGGGGAAITGGVGASAGGGSSWVDSDRLIGSASYAVGSKWSNGSMLIVALPSNASVFQFTGAAQVYAPAASGSHRIVLAGAAGSTSMVAGTGGMGGLMTMVTDLDASTTYDVMVGGKGSESSAGGFNGGGSGGSVGYYKGGGGGGGTDIRPQGSGSDSRLAAAGGGGGFDALTSGDGMTSISGGGNPATGGGYRGGQAAAGSSPGSGVGNGTNGSSSGVGGDGGQATDFISTQAGGGGGGGFAGGGGGPGASDLDYSGAGGGGSSYAAAVATDISYINTFIQTNGFAVIEPLTAPDPTPSPTGSAGPTPTASPTGSGGEPAPPVPQLNTAPARPQLAFVTRRPHAKKYRIAWKAPAATPQIRYRVRVFQPGTKKIILRKVTTQNHTIIKRVELLHARNRLRGDVRTTTAYRVQVIAHANGVSSAPLRVKIWLGI